MEERLANLEQKVAALESEVQELRDKPRYDVQTIQSIEKSILAGLRASFGVNGQQPT